MKKKERRRGNFKTQGETTGSFVATQLYRTPNQRSIPFIHSFTLSLIFFSLLPPSSSSCYSISIRPALLAVVIVGVSYSEVQPSRGRRGGTRTTLKRNRDEIKCSLLHESYFPIFFFRLDYCAGKLGGGGGEAKSTPSPPPSQRSETKRPLGLSY